MGTSISAIIQVTTPPLGVAPGQMAAPVVSGVTSTSLTLTWMAPATGDPPIVYQAQQSLQSPTNFSNIGGPISGLVLAVTGLTPATNYEFQIVASNATGSSISPVTLVTTLAILPGAPTGLAVVGSPGTTDVSLTWVAPVVGTRPLTYTVLSRTPSGSGSFVAGPTTSNTALDFTGLVSGASYDFQVTATNSVGTGPASGTVTATTATTAVIPTAPQSPTIGTVAQTSVQVSWTTPLSGTPPLSYVLQFRTPPGAGAFTSRPSTTSLTDTATGLIASTSYQFQVLATNSVGTGPASAQVSATTLVPPPVLPTAPTGLTSTAVTTTTVSLTWTTPTTGTLPLTYQPQWSLAGAGTWTNGTPTTSTSGQITGLTPGTNFDFRVGASNAAGTGPFSSTFTTTTTAQIPAAPTNLAVGTVTQTSAQLTWTAPSTGTPPFSYVLQWSPHNAGTFTNVAIASGVTTGTVTGLSASTAYDFQVEAVNSAGTGPASALVSSTTLAPPPVLPSAPTGLAFVSSTTASVTFSWSAPATGTTPFTYQTQWSLTGANSWTNGPAPSVATAQVTGLTAGTTYDLRVQALNTAGSGPFSSPITASTATAVTAITWNPNKISGTTLSADLLTATATGSSTPYSLNQGVLATASNSSGQHWFQVTMSTLTPNFSVGLANSGVVLTIDAGSNPNSAVFFPNTAAVNEQPAQSAYFNGSPILTPSGVPAADTAGHVITVCVDFPGARWWVQTPAMVLFYGANSWNDSSIAVPGVGAAGIGGIPTSVTGALFPAFMTAEGGGVAVLNATATPVGSAVIPTSFSSWGGITQTTTTPNAVTGLAAGTPADVSVPLTWTQPTIGTQPLTYTMQFQPTSGTNTAQQVGLFLDSMGVNTHLEFNDGTYANFNACVTALQFLGIKKIRDGVPDPTGGSPYTNYVNALNAVGAAGMSATLFVHPPNSIATCLTELANREIAHPGMINAVEGPNETNNFPITFNSQTSPTADVPYQTALYTAVKAHVTLKTKPVYYYTGSYTTSTLTGRADFANGHPYPTGGNQPAPRLDSEYTDHFVSPLTLGSYPRVGTETGYSSLVVSGGVDQATQAKNTLNSYLDAFRQGLSEIYPYQLLDAYSPVDFDGAFGFFNIDFTPKPVATAVHNLTTILADSTPAFADEFRTTTTITDTGDSTHWMNHYPFGGSEFTLPANNEAQYYASASRTPGFSPFSASRGALVITADTVAHTVTNPLSLPYNSGVITSVIESAGAPAAGLYSQQYGYFEARLKFPKGRGLWPAFWLLPLTGAGEIDIMENLGQDTTTIYCSLHATTGGGSVSVPLGFDASLDFHNYGLDWQPTFITWYVDGVQVAQLPTPSDMVGKPYYILCNLAVGAVGSFPGAPDGSTVFPAPLYVEYIRAFAQRPRVNTLAYTLTGMPPLGKSLLLQKSNGVFELCIWAETADWSNGGLAQIAVPPVTVTVTFASTMQTVTVYDPTISATAQQTFTNVTSVQVGVADHPLILEVTPAWLTDGTSATTSGTVPGLTPQTSYDFRVSAANSGGAGGSSNIVSAMTASTVFLPGAPSSLSISGATSSSLSATWQQPMTGSTPTGYQLQYKLSSSNTFANAPQWLESANGKTLNTTAGQIVDSIGNTFQISSGAQLIINGVLDGTTANAVLVKYWGHRLYHENTTPSWYVYNGTPGNYSQVAGDPALTIAADTSFTQIVGGLASSTTYNFQVDAFNAQGSGAFSSPVASGTTLSGVPTNTTVNLASPTGRTLSKYVFGFATGALGDNSFLFAADATAKTSMAVIRPTLLRVNSQLQTIEQWASGNTGVMNNFWNNAASFMDPTYRLVMGCGPTFNDTSVSPATRATNTANFASAMRSQGHEIFYWEVGNECQGMGVSAYNGYFNAIYDALKGVNSSYIVGGPTADWWNDIDLNSWASGIGGRAPGFCSIHSYPVGPATSTAQCYINMSGFGDVDSTRSSLEGHGNTAGIPIGLLEYNMDGNPGEDSRQGTYVGAVHIGLQLVRSFRGTGSNVPNFQMGGMWDIIQDSNYGAVGNSSSGGNNAVVAPQGYYLGKAGQVMAGTEVGATTSIGSLQILATKSGSTFAIQLINYSTTSAATASITLSGGTVSGSVARWEIGKSNQTTPATSTQASLSSVSVPSEQIVILTGSFV